MSDPRLVVVSQTPLDSRRVLIQARWETPVEPKEPELTKCSTARCKNSVLRTGPLPFCEECS